MSKKEYQELVEELKTIPKGTITKKKISNKIRYYFQWRDENKKTRSRYLKVDEVPDYQKIIHRRQEIEILIKQYQKEYKELFINRKVTFKTAISLKEDLDNKTKIIKGFKCRYQFEALKRYLTLDSNKIIALYGLRRTGKTTMLLQAIDYIGIDDSAYIKIKPDNTMDELLSDLDILLLRGIKNVFIDEITLIQDFISQSAMLADYYAMSGMKIVLSGTDSLSFYLATNQELYDRCYLIHTSYISYKEYAYLLDIHDIDSYIEYGGTLKKENVDYQDLDFFEDTMSFEDEESTRKYIDTAISRNIQNSLKNDIVSNQYKHLSEIYKQDKLTGIINKIVEDINHSFLKEVVSLSFKSHDFGSLKQIISQNNVDIIDKIDEKQLIDKLKTKLQIKDVKVDDNQLNEIKTFLYKLDLIIDLKERISTGKVINSVAFIQPGMRYSIAKTLLSSLFEDDYFMSLDYKTRENIKTILLNDVKGKMLEEIINIALIKKYNKKDYDIFKYRFIRGGEFDIVVVNNKNHDVDLYEIKHTSNINSNQTKYLDDNNMLNAISYSFGNIKNKYVLYKGDNKKINDINYVNIERFLSSL